MPKNTVISTGEKNTVFYVRFNGLTSKQLKVILHSAKVRQYDKGKHAMLIELSDINRDTALLWYQIFRNAKLPCPPYILGKIGGDIPSTLSNTLMYSCTPICDKLNACEAFGRNFDREFDLTVNAQMGAMSGREDHAKLRDLASMSGISIGGDGIVDEDWEEKYHNLNDKYKEAIEVMKMLQIRLADEMQRGSEVTLHDGLDQMVFIVDPPHGIEVYGYGQFKTDPPCVPNQLMVYPTVTNRKRLPKSTEGDGTAKRPSVPKTAEVHRKLFPPFPTGGEKQDQESDSDTDSEHFVGSRPQETESGGTVRTPQAQDKDTNDPETEDTTEV